MENTREHKRSIFAWTTYDWANSAFVTTISAAVLPVYFSNVAAAHLPDYQRTAIWSWTTAIYMILVALMGPIFGAMADFSGTKKKNLFFFAAFAAGASACAAKKSRTFGYTTSRQRRPLKMP